VLLTDLVEAVAARRTPTPGVARSIIYSTVTAALLQSPRVPFAVRFDSPAAVNRPGWLGTWQRRRERVVLERAKLLLPWSDGAAAAAAAASPAAAPSIVLPPPVECVGRKAERDVEAVAYAGNPDKRGLALLCNAWQRAAPASGGPLIVTGLEPSAARRFLRRHGVAEPSRVEWAGLLAHDDWLDLVARARIFISASRDEEWGLAPMEALAAGTPLVTVPTRGLNEALRLARTLAPSLVASVRDVVALAAAIRAGLDLTEDARRDYGKRATAALSAYDRATVLEIVAREVLPRLLA
jgi:glycosyltransferase involved in cell wall biosynthesis